MTNTPHRRGKHYKLYRGASKTTLSVENTLQGSQDSTQVVLMAMIYYSEKIKSKINNGRKHMEWSPEMSRHELPGVLSSPRLHRRASGLQTILVKCCPPGMPIMDSVSKHFTGGCSHRQPLPGTYQNFRLLEGKQVFSINQYCLYKQYRHSKWPLSLREQWEPSSNPSSQKPTTGQPCKQAFPKQLSQTCYVNSFLHKIL